MQSSEALAISEVEAGVDVEVTNSLYRRWPAFGSVVPEGAYRHYQREIDMGSDRDLFGDTEPGLPLYEGRMIGQYDYRAKAYRSGRGRSAVWEDLRFDDPTKAIVPQWRVPRRNVPSKLKGREGRYRVAFCDVTGPNNERSLIASMVPREAVCGHSAPTIEFERGHEWSYVGLLANLNSLVMDFLLRKNIGNHVTFTILDALPIPRLELGDERLDSVAPLVLRLTCTGLEMTAFWNSMAPYGWCDAVSPDEVPSDALLVDEDRAIARAQIDALVARHVYGLGREELEHILTTFPTLARNEERAYGEFRTQRLVLDAFDVV